jgi:hypothetical protein
VIVLAEVVVFVGVITEMVGAVVSGIVFATVTEIVVEVVALFEESVAMALRM